VYLVNLSTITKIALYPLLSGKSTVKSIVITSNG
jgi:hypothetical protein